MSVFPERAGPVRMAQRFAQPAALDSPAKAAAFESVMMRLDDAPLRSSSKGKAIWRIDSLNALMDGVAVRKGPVPLAQWI